MPGSDSLDPVFQEAGTEWNVDPQLLKAIAQAESGGKTNARSRAGAGGLMQIMPDTGRGLGMTNLDDPVQSIWGGAKYMAQALDAEKTPEDALRYYHGGPDWRSPGKYGPESQAYASRVTAAYAQAGSGATAVAKAKTVAPKTDATDDFLSGKTSTAPAPTVAASAPAAAAGPDATDDFLSGKGAVAAPVKTELKAAEQPGMADPGQNEYGITSDPQQFNKQKPGLTGPKSIDELRASVEAMPSGYFGMIPAVRSLALGALDVGQGRVMVGGGGVDEPSPNAFSLRPTGDTVNLLSLAAGTSPGTGTGRAIADTVDYGAPAERLFGPRNPENRLVMAAPDRELPTPAAPSNRLAMSLPPQEMPLPAMAGGAPGPQSVGAAASRDMSSPSVIDMTPQEVQAYRSTAEGQKLLEPQQPGIEDRNPYVPGVAASTAEIEQTVNAAREAKTANVQHPEVSQAAKDQAAANNEARQRFLENTVKSPVDAMNARAARAAQADADLAETWKAKTAADAQPVVDAADAIKASPDGRRPVVRSAVDAVTKELYDANDKLITDPEQLYGVRKHVDDLLSKEAGATDPKSIRAAANLQQLKATLDEVIEKAAPGFRDYLKNFTEASRPIDEMELLQGHQNRLYDTQGRLQLSRVQSLMRNIVDSRAAPGINPYKSISDETMQRLWALRDDLRRSASAQELARTPGSDTTQTMFDLAKRGAAIGGNLVAGGIAHHIAPIAGPIILNTVRGVASHRSAAAAQRAGVAKGMSNINPNRLITPQD